MSDFFEDIKKGSIGEQIFIDDFLNYLGIKYIDVTGCQKFQVIDTDYLTTIGTYEIKTNYKDNKVLILEEYTNISEEYGNISLGWMYKTQSNLIIFISKETRTMIFLPFTDRFKEYYKTIAQQYELIKNKPSHNKGKYWQSAFRKIPFDALNGYISIYKRI